MSIHFPAELVEAISEYLIYAKDFVSLGLTCTFYHSILLAPLGNIRDLNNEKAYHYLFRFVRYQIALVPHPDTPDHYRLFIYRVLDLSMRHGPTTIYELTDDQWRYIKDWSTTSELYSYHEVNELLSERLKDPDWEAHSTLLRAYHLERLKYPLPYLQAPERSFTTHYINAITCEDEIYSLEDPDRGSLIRRSWKGLHSKNSRNNNIEQVATESIENYSQDFPWRQIQTQQCGYENQTNGDSDCYTDEFNPSGYRCRRLRHLVHHRVPNDQTTRETEITREKWYPSGLRSEYVKEFRNMTLPQAPRDDRDNLFPECFQHPFMQQVLRETPATKFMSAHLVWHDAPHGGLALRREWIDNAELRQTWKYYKNGNKRQYMHWHSSPTHNYEFYHSTYYKDGSLAFEIRWINGNRQFRRHYDRNGQLLRPLSNRYRRPVSPKMPQVNNLNHSVIL